jgi:hypothetical protein
MKSVAIAAALAGLAALPAAAVPFNGTLAADDDVALFDVLVEDIRSFVSVETVSYAGGTLSDGTEVAAGGFDPVLAIFDSAGSLIATNNDDPDAAEDPATGGAFDAFLRPGSPLDIGTYTVAVSQYDSFPVGPTLADGYDEDDPSFTAKYFCDAGQFCDFTGADRTADWALEVSVAPVPLPAGGLLLLGALGGLAMARRRT